MGDPTGVAYLKTFQALYQVGELVTGLLAWALLASGPYMKYGPMCFALGALVTAWVATLTFFIIYIFGIHVRINTFFSSRSSSGGESGESTSGSLAPPSGSVPQIRWFVVEYIIYFIAGVLLFVAAVCMTSQLHKQKVWFAACAIGWFLAVMYEIHFCMLFRNVESLWPYEWVISCFKKCCPERAEQAESERLVPASGVSDQPAAE